MVVMDLEMLQFPTPRLVTAATFQMRRSVNVNECHQPYMMQTERGESKVMDTAKLREKDFEANNS